MFKVLWSVKLGKDSIPLLLTFGLLFGITFAGIAIDMLKPSPGFEALVVVCLGFLFGQVLSVMLTKAVSL